MRKAEVKRMIERTPNTRLVEFFFDEANLTRSEREVLMACVRDELTYEEAEEKLNFCVRTIGRKHKSAMDKLSAYLDGMCWLLDCPVYK